MTKAEDESQNLNRPEKRALEGEMIVNFLLSLDAKVFEELSAQFKILKNNLEKKYELISRKRKIDSTLLFNFCCRSFVYSTMICVMNNQLVCLHFPLILFFICCLNLNRLGVLMIRYVLCFI